MRWAVLFFVLLAPAGAAAVPLDALDPDAVYALAAVRIEGAETVSVRALRSVMRMHPTPWYQPWKRWLEPAIFDPNLLRSDLERIRAWLREAGRYEAAVDCDLILDGNRVTVVVVVHEGPVVVLKSVAVETVDFSPTGAEEEALRAEVPFVAGAPFTQAAYDAGRDRIALRLERRGFAYARVEKAARVDTGTHEAEVRYLATRGRAAVFGITYVEGTSQVAMRLVRREIAYRQGDPFDPGKLDETQARIFGLRLFRSVLVRPRNLDERSGVVDVAVTVVEGPPREILAGVGYGLEDGVRGQLRWQHNDFFGGGRQLGFRLKGSEIEQVVEGEFRQPYFLHPQQTFIAPLTQLRDDEPGFTVARIRFAPRIERKLPRRLTVSAGYSVEYDDLSNVPSATVARLDGGRDAYVGRGIVSSLTGVVERNTTVDLLDPREGSVVTLAVEQAGGPWQGAYSFYTAVVDAKAYVPLPGGRTLAGRVRLGTGDGFGQSRDLPMFRRFYAGGITSTRGYGRHMLGPLNDDEDPVGGRSLLEASLELRTPVYGPFGGAIFFDAGEVRRRVASWTLGDLEFGTGVGVRYHTLVGPLRVDFGVPLDPPKGERRWQVHFSIGQAF
ncbi:MAG: BamA/TamA family outer membrane protein [Deltaproteobacteria bacterium]|nr:BamA/TamA family outer membrane protein [Deltaproteobacteria bacterium]